MTQEIRLPLPEPSAEIWRPMPRMPEGIGCLFRGWEHGLVPLRVLRSISTVRDGSRWVHLSIARKDQMPSWDEIVRVRNEFLGENVEAYQVCPRMEDYVNVHQYCLHVWAPMDGIRRVANLMDLIEEVRA